MRIGLYIGRHKNSAGGMWVYSRSLLVELLERLATERNQGTERETELVVYGDSAILSPEFFAEIAALNILTATAGSVLSASADSYFQPLPNGARLRVLFRILPSFCGRRLGSVLDQLMIPLFAVTDRISILHATTNFGFPLYSLPQIVTVHDLFQAWLSAPALPRRSRVFVLKAIYRRYYRRLFSWQFRVVSHVITDAKQVAGEIQRRFHFDAARITPIPLGLDTTFAKMIEWIRVTSEGQAQLQAWQRDKKLPAGYVLVLASRDPRKNLVRTLRAWQQVVVRNGGPPLVVNLSDPDAKTLVTQTIPVELLEKQVCILANLPRLEMPFLYAGASIVLLPTLGEGFGLPALEALALGRSVVTGRLEQLEDYEDTCVFFCDPHAEKSIVDALRSAIEKENQREKSSSTRNYSGNQLWSKCRTMKDVSNDTFLVYQRVNLQYKPLHHRVV